MSNVWGIQMWYLSLMLSILLTFVNIGLIMVAAYVIMDLWPDVKRKWFDR